MLSSCFDGCMLSPSKQFLRLIKMTNTNQIEFNINPLTSDEDVIIINQSIENFRAIKHWKGLNADIIGKRVAIGFGTFVIIGLNKKVKKSRLVVQHVENLKLYDVSFKTVERDLRLQGIVPIV